MALKLKTIGHATLIVEENGVPLLATDPWLIGSNYWRSWWLEKYPTQEEIEEVKNAKEIYVTHSHPDHLHLPSLRKLGARTVMHPYFPHYKVPPYLESVGFKSKIMTPWKWYPLSSTVRVASVPVPIDDSIIVIDSPSAVVVNINDSMPRKNLLSLVKKRLVIPGKKVVVLKSYSPASAANAFFKEGKRISEKSKKDYTDVARTMAETLNADYFIPFASQVFFSRKDSRWANEYKVHFEDLKQYWGQSAVELCPPFIDMDLEKGTYSTSYHQVNRTLDSTQLDKIRARELEETENFSADNLDDLLLNYFDKHLLFRLLYRKGFGWRLSTSNTERFYNSKRRTIEHKIPAEYDLIVTLPDKVLFESLQNGVLTDLGITMLIRVETKTSLRLTYLAFLLMGLRDYGHLDGLKAFIRFAWFYTPYFFPFLDKKYWSPSLKLAR